MNKSSKTIVLLIALFAFSVLLGGCGANTTVGIVDVNKVMTDSPKVKQYQEQLNVKGKELTDQLEKDKPNISAEEFQKRQETAYNDFLKVKQDMENQIQASMQQALQQVAQDKKIGIVLYKTSVAQGGTDITDDVMAKMQ